MPCKRSPSKSRVAFRRLPLNRRFTGMMLDGPAFLRGFGLASEGGFAGSPRFWAERRGSSLHGRKGRFRPSGLRAAVAVAMPTRRFRLFNQVAAGDRFTPNQAGLCRRRAAGPGRRRERQGRACRRNTRGLARLGRIHTPSGPPILLKFSAVGLEGGALGPRVFRTGWSRSFWTVRACLVCSKGVPWNPSPRSDRAVKGSGSPGSQGGRQP